MSSLKTIFCILIIQPSDDREKSIQKMAEACIRFTPQISIFQNEAIFLDITKSLTLFSKESLNQRILVLARRLKIAVHITEGNHSCIALAKAHYPSFQKSQKLVDLPLEGLRHFLSPQQNSADLKQNFQSLVKSLKALGLKSAEDYLCLPSEGLGARFGLMAVQIHSHLQGRAEPVWRFFSPSPIIEEFVQLHDEEIGPTDTLEPIIFLFKGLIDRIIIRLRGLNKKASKILIEIQVAPWSITKKTKLKWELSLPIAQGSSIGLIAIVREFLSKKLEQTPLEAPIQAIKLQILETVPGHGAQTHFFHSKEIEVENKDQLLGRLLQKLGASSVFQVALNEKYSPEKTWSRISPSLKENENVPPTSLPFISRPTRILATPEPLSSLPSVLIHASGAKWKILKMEGPERISTEWWEDQNPNGIERDYYAVTTQSGEKLWIFINRGPIGNQLFLHGYFD